MAPAWLSPRTTRGLVLAGGGLCVLACLWGLSGGQRPAVVGQAPLNSVPAPPQPPPGPHGHPSPHGPADPHGPVTASAAPTEPFPMPPEMQGVDLLRQTDD